jgi:hypothetical protein
MRCSACGRAKAVQTAGGNAPGRPRLARGWAWPSVPWRTGMPAVRASAAMPLRLRWRYSFLAYLGRLMATRGMNRSSTIARTRSGGIGL